MRPSRRSSSRAVDGTRGSDGYDAPGDWDGDDGAGDSDGDNGAGDSDGDDGVGDWDCGDVPSGWGASASRIANSTPASARYQTWVSLAVARCCWR